MVSRIEAHRLTIAPSGAHRLPVLAGTDEAQQAETGVNMYAIRITKTAADGSTDISYFDRDDGSTELFNSRSYAAKIAAEIEDNDNSRRTICRVEFAA